jgi:hypothetical protein
MQPTHPPTTTTLRILRRTAQAAVAAALLLSSTTSCKKKTPPPPAATSTAIPTIDTSNKSGTFGKDAWIAQQAANLHNVTAVPNDSYAHVSYKPNVTIVDKSTFDACLEGIGSTGHGIVFKNAPASILALKAGDFFMVKGQFAAKILAAETTGGETVVVTDFAKLSDIVAKGDIHLNTGINFHGPALSTLKPPAAPPSPRQPFHLSNLFETPVYAAQNGTGTPPGPNSFTPTYQNPTPGTKSSSASDEVKNAATDLLSGWNVKTFSVVPSQNNAAITIKMTKDVGGFVAAVGVDGTVSNFQFAQTLTLPNISTQVMNGVKGMSGTFHFTWEIGKQTPGVWAQGDKIRLPAGITIPLAEMLDGLPLTLDISAAMLIHPALTGGSEYSKGGFTITFNGSNDSEGLKFQIDDDQSISAVAPTAMVISFCVPRIELRLGIVGSYANDATATITGRIDSAIGYLVGKLPAGVQKALSDSPLGKMSVTNALASNADLFVQVIHTEGATHAPNISLAPCKKVQLKVTGQWGGDATLFNLIPGASSTKDIYTKEFDRWDPGSDFCKSV